MFKKSEATAIARKQLQLRDALWPGFGQHLWDRKSQKGFTTIPKTMPLVLQAMDEMTKNTPVSSTYLSLWCSTWDNSFVVLSKVVELASAAGFGGQRGERTWASRMKLLHALHFIQVKPSIAGPLGYAIILNPHLVVRWHHDQRTAGLSEATYNALLEKALEVGAIDMAQPSLDLNAAAQ